MFTGNNLTSNAVLLVLACVAWLQLCPSAAGQGTAAIVPGNINCAQRFCLRCISALEAASQGPCACPICPVPTNPCDAVLCVACMPAQPLDSAAASGKTSVVPIGTGCCPVCG
ncbi:uncharacterized protein LOC129591734 [Paramacrobiotus metropolitanus]|uniref:uncharacterized protein LOC129591734 n=1 Tax=Paramacrobiotus metropolitanus TaxID=2943436 RepID=UPI002445CD0B|nr:uncharacterized protein LOC129591734 [Paramacrobiotus metropolitanus]